MRKKILNKIIAVIGILLIFAFVANISNAVTVDDVNKFNATTHTATGSGAVQTIIGMVLDVVRLVGASIAVIMLMTIGAKYMIASSGDRADIKKYAFNYVIGAVILFAASGILTALKNTIIK